MLGACMLAAALVGAATAGYHDYAQFTESLRTLAKERSGAVRLEPLAETTEGRQVWLVEIAPGAQPAEERPAVLIVGGIDAAYPGTSEIALLVARRLAEQATDAEADWLDTHTVYVLPRMNPDGIERYFERVKHAAGGNMQPLDEDRDNVVDEDGPNDLNGDGLITVMRFPSAEGQWAVDVDAPQLLKKAERAKGERGIYEVFWEGADDDGDGLINEDAAGGVDLDRNFPHLYEPNPMVTGAHQLSEPATRALAEFVVAHPRIVAAIVYGKHDNIVKVSKSKERDVTKRAYRALHPDDIPRYEFLSTLFKETTGLKSSPGGEPAGALYAWLYSQRGIWTFATPAWEPKIGDEAAAPGGGSADEDGEPQAKAEGAEQGGAEPGQDPAIAAAERETGETLAGEEGSAERGKAERQTRVSPGELGLADADRREARFASSKAARAWLEYSTQQRDGAGFVAWTKVAHPTLGEVEVGGFAPYFLTTPPAEELAEAAEKQTEFVKLLVEKLPQLTLEPAEVRGLGGDVFSVTVRLINSGFLPTHGGIGGMIDLDPITLRVDLPRERLLSGRPVERVNALEGGGAIAGQTWLVRGKPGSVVRITAYHRRLGQWETDVKLEDARYPLAGPFAPMQKEAE